MATDSTSTARDGDAVVCPGCGFVSPTGMRFCGHCGSSLDAAVAAAPAAASTAPSAPSAPVAPPAAEMPVPAPARPPVPGAAAPTQQQTPVRTQPQHATSAARLPHPAIRPAGSASRPSSGVPSAELVARERECDRLLSRANVQRMRAQILDARKTLDEALVLAEGLPGPNVAPIYEMIGDMAAMEERWEQAANAYEMAHRLDPARATAERKFGEMTIRLADETAIASLANGDALVELASSPRGRRNPGIAMILSLFVPGFGQFYNGDFLKGVLFVIASLVSLVLAALSAGPAVLKCLFVPSHSCQGIAVPGITWMCVVVGFGVWLASLIDAPISATKTQDLVTVGGQQIDKTGWEP